MWHRVIFGKRRAEFAANVTAEVENVKFVTSVGVASVELGILDGAGPASLKPASVNALPLLLDHPAVFIETLETQTIVSRRGRPRLMLLVLV